MQGCYYSPEDKDMIDVIVKVVVQKIFPNVAKTVKNTIPNATLV